MDQTDESTREAQNVCKDQEAPWGLYLLDAQCQIPAARKLPCGHKAKGLCSLCTLQAAAAGHKTAFAAVTTRCDSLPCDSLPTVSPARTAIRQLMILEHQEQEEGSGLQQLPPCIPSGQCLAQFSAPLPRLGHPAVGAWAGMHPRHLIYGVSITASCEVESRCFPGFCFSAVLDLQISKRQKALATLLPAHLWENKNKSKNTFQALERV